MIIPEHQDGKKDDSLIAFQKVTETVENSRQAGGQQSDAAIIPRIIVDMREFRSDLPCLIHRRGIQVIPVTITVNSFGRAANPNKNRHATHLICCCFPIIDWRLHPNA